MTFQVSILPLYGPLALKKPQLDFDFHHSFFREVHNHQVANRNQHFDVGNSKFYLERAFARYVMHKSNFFSRALWFLTLELWDWHWPVQTLPQLIDIIVSANEELSIDVPLQKCGKDVRTVNLPTSGKSFQTSVKNISYKIIGASVFEKLISSIPEKLFVTGPTLKRHTFWLTPSFCLNSVLYGLGIFPGDREVFFQVLLFSMVVSSFLITS